MIFVRIIVGLIVIAGCVAMMKYSVQLTNITGKIGLAEKYLGSPLAGTYTFYKLFGLLIMILMIVWIFTGFKFLPG
jgi:hypothetical protein